MSNELDPEDLAVLAVQADALQTSGDPRGELIALQLAAENPKASPKQRAAAQAAADKHLARNAGELVGPLADVAEGMRALVWRRGFIHRIELDATRDLDPPRLLALALAHPSGRWLAELELRDLRRDGAMVREALAVFGRYPPLRLRSLVVDARVDLGEIGLIGELQTLHELSLRASMFELGTIALRELRRAAFHGLGLSPSCVTSIARMTTPALERLEVGIGYEPRDVTGIDDLRPLFERTDLGALTHLRFKRVINRVPGDLGDQIARALTTSPLAAQLQVLQMPSVTCQGALDLAAGTFPQLRELWIAFGSVSETDAQRAAAAIAVAKLAKHVVDPTVRGAIDPFDKEYYDEVYDTAPDP